MLGVTEVGGVNIAGPQLGSQCVRGHTILLAVLNCGVTLVMSVYSCQNKGSQNQSMPKCGFTQMPIAKLWGHKNILLGRHTKDPRF